MGLSKPDRLAQKTCDQTVQATRRELCHCQSGGLATFAFGPLELLVSQIFEPKP